MNNKSKHFEITSECLFLYSFLVNREKSTIKKGVMHGDITPFTLPSFISYLYFLYRKQSHLTFQ